MKILIFTEGTILMHKSAMGYGREEIVGQVKEKEKSVNDYASYIPIHSAVRKLKSWEDYGVKIVYLTSRKKSEEIDSIQKVLRRYDFPNGELLFRKGKNEYANVAEKILPDILIEDDRESIGGKKEMTITNIKPAIKKKIKSIIVHEFEGIDHLPDDPQQLMEI